MALRQNIAIIYSNESRQEYIMQAQRNKSIYNFSASCGRTNWVQGEYAYLSVNGLSSILRRLGIKHDIVKEDLITMEELRCYSFIFIPNGCRLSNRFIDILSAWRKDGRGIFVSGKSNLLPAFLGCSEYNAYKPEKYIGIRWHKEYGDNLLDNLPLSPPGYEITLIKADSKSERLGSLVEYIDIDNKRANESNLDSDALVKNKNTIYLSLPVFEFVGEILQGHMDIESLRTSLGAESNFYIDRICMIINRILKEAGFYSLYHARIRPWGNYDNVFILRHDTDDSCDDAYFDYELKNNIPATYAILLDRNRKIWSERISKVPFLEYAYHFRTNKDGLVSKFLRKFLKIGDEADKGAITRMGLLRQVLVAERKFGVRIKTLQRHFSYFFYPETIESIKVLYDNCPSVLGMGTMFRFTNIRYSNLGKCDMYTVVHPNVSVPFWFPFKMVIATTESFEILRGWDMASFIEPDSAMTDLIFNNARLIINGVYTFGFHPAHAKGKKINAGGNYEWFLYSIEMAKKNNWWIANCEMVYKKLNDWEDIVFRFDDEMLTLYNPTDRTIRDILIETDMALNGINDIYNGNLEVLHPGLFAVSELKPKEEIRCRILPASG